jgi:hypothetical protein
MYTELRHHVLVNSHISPRSAGEIPPSFQAIPLSSTMEIPVPFLRNAVQHFSKCHVGSILNPDFFTGDGWTEYFCAILGNTTIFNAIGDRNVDLVYDNNVGQWSGLGEFPEGRDFESVVRFQLVEPHDADHDHYTLKSNNFYSEVELDDLTTTVERSTGRLSIAH